MNTAISPWDYFACCESPDGMYLAVYDDAQEIAMGGPTRGTLTIKNKMNKTILHQFEGLAASFVWSSDSKAIAAARWTSGREQELCVIWIPGGRIDVSPDRFRVLQIHSFSDYRVRGIDSPIHKPQTIDLLFHASDDQSA